MLYTHNSESPLIKGIKLSSPTHQVFDSRSDNMLSYKIITVASNISEVSCFFVQFIPLLKEDLLQWSNVTLIIRRKLIGNVNN